MSHHHTHDRRDEEDSSQVRHIIRQLNEDAPSKEKKREVVVRSDGSKMVRVTKKRRVMVTQEEKRRRSRKSFMMGLFVVLLAAAAFAAFFSYRMSSMSGQAYLEQREQELARLWGASSVRCSGAVIDGTSFHISNVVVDFPESSMLERVEMSEIEAELDMGTFISGVLTGDELTIARAHVRLRSSARQLHIPQAQGERLWRFARVSCPDFSVSFGGDDAASPWSVRHSAAYMYRPSESSTITVLTLDGGVMKMRGWKDISIRTGKLHFSQLALDDFYLSGTTDGANATTESLQTTISLSGGLTDGASLAGPYYFVSDNMNFSDFSEGRFNQFFSARTVRPAQKSGAPSTQVLLPVEQTRPQFSGTFHLKEVSISGFPAQQLILEHLDPTKRKRYMPPYILFASARLNHEDGAQVLSFDESGMTERDVITMRGNIRVDDGNNLSGTLDYGIPFLLTHAEYLDGKADPIFREDGQLAWLSTKLSGPASHPDDDSRETDARVAAERAARERVPFDNIDLDRVSEQFRGPQGGESSGTSLGTPEGGEGDNRLSPSAPLTPGSSIRLPGESPLDSPF